MFVKMPVLRTLHDLTLYVKHAIFYAITMRKRMLG